MRLGRWVVGAGLIAALYSSPAQQRFEPTMLDRSPSKEELEDRIVDSLSQEYISREGVANDSKIDGNTIDLGLNIYFDKRFMEQAGDSISAMHEIDRMLDSANAIFEEAHNGRPRMRYLVHLKRSRCAIVNIDDDEEYLDARLALGLMEHDLRQGNINLYITGYDLAVPDSGNRSTRLTFTDPEGYCSLICGLASYENDYALVEYQEPVIESYMPFMFHKADRISLNAQIIAHEIFHCIGAGHDLDGFGSQQRENLMYTEGGGGVTRRTAKQAELYLRKIFPKLVFR